MSPLLRNLNRSVSIIVFGVLVGCASTAEISIETRALVGQQWRELDAAQTCCDDLSDIAYANLPDSGHRFMIQAGRARTFVEGKSYFYGLDVSRFKTKTLLMVKDHQVLWRKHGLPYIIKPSVIMLGANAQETSKLINMPLCYSQGWTREATGYFSILEVDPSRASRLVFFAAQSARNGTTKFGSSATTAGGGQVVTVQVDYDFPHAPVGELEVVPLSEKMQTYLKERCPDLF